MPKVNLSPTKLASLRPVWPDGRKSLAKGAKGSQKKAGAKLAKGERYALMDTQVPGFGIRVNHTGLRTFVLRMRYPGETHAAWRALGEYPVIGLAEARAKASEWRTLVKRGIDPSDQEAREAFLDSIPMRREPRPLVRILCETGSNVWAFAYRKARFRACDIHLCERGLRPLHGVGRNLCRLDRRSANRHFLADLGFLP